MSVAGFSKKPRVYVPQKMKGAANPPTFTIRRLNRLELLDISEKHSDPNETIDLGGIEEENGGERTMKVKVSFLNKLVRTKHDIVCLALTDWTNVEDEDGQPIPFSVENIAFLDNDLVNELSDVAQGVITEKEAKNSDSPSA